MFGPVRGGGATKPLSRHLADAKAFEKQFIRLCLDFGFDVRNPTTYDDICGPNDWHLSDAGKLGFPIAVQLCRTLEKSRVHRAELENDLTDLKRRNKKRKRGPQGMPAFFAEHVLVGIHLYDNSSVGVSLLKNFLSQGGELAEWLAKNSSVKDFAMALVCASADPWAIRTRQSLERVVLSDELGKEVKATNKFKEELDLLRVRVSERAAHIVQTVDQQSR